MKRQTVWLTLLIADILSRIVFLPITFILQERVFFHKRDIGLRYLAFLFLILGLIEAYKLVKIFKQANSFNAGAASAFKNGSASFFKKPLRTRKLQLVFGAFFIFALICILIFETDEYTPKLLFTTIAASAVLISNVIRYRLFKEEPL